MRGDQALRFASELHERMTVVRSFVHMEYSGPPLLILRSEASLRWTVASWVREIVLSFYADLEAAYEVAADAMEEEGRALDVSYARNQMVGVVRHAAGLFRTCVTGA